MIEKLEPEIIEKLINGVIRRPLCEVEEKINEIIDYLNKIEPLIYTHGVEHDN